MSKTPPSFGLPEPGEGKRGEEGHIGYLLRQAAAAHRYRMEKAMAAFGITSPQFSVLTMLSAYPGHSNADLARLALLTPQTVSVIIANLERSDLVARRPHAIHGRIQHLDLTAKGRALLNNARANANTIENNLVAGMTPRQERIIRRWLVSAATGNQETPENRQAHAPKPFSNV